MFPLINRNRGRISLLILHALLAGSLLVPFTSVKTAFGADIKLIPSCELKEEYNDNVFLTTDNRESDWITTLTPGLAFSYASERLNIELLTGLSWREYARTKDIDTLDYQYNAQVAKKLSLQDDLGLSAIHVRNTRPDSISESTGLAAKSGTDHYQYSASLGRLINETTSASLAYSFVQDEYDNPASLANHVHNLNMIVSKDLGSVMPLLKGKLSSNFSRAVYRDSTSDNYTISIGANRNINEKISVNLSAGGHLVHLKFMSGLVESNDSWGAIGSALLNYTGEKGFGSLSFAHNYSAASGQVGAVETTSFGLTLGRSLSDKMTAQIAASYNINREVSGQYSTRGSDNNRVINLKADIANKISKYFDIGIQYAYYTVTYDLSESQISQNSVMLRVVAKYPVTL